MHARTRPARQKDVFYPDPIIREVQELSAIGRRTVYKAGDTGLTRHTHDAAEICYIERGVVWWRLGSTLHEVRGGEAYVTLPGEVHGGLHDVINPCKLYWLQVPLWPGGRLDGRTFLNLPADEAKALMESLTKIPVRRFPAPHSITGSCERIPEAINTPESPLRTARIRLELLRVLLEITESASVAPKRAPSAIAQMALRLMDENLERPLPLSDLAGRLGKSQSYLEHRFRAETGIPPGEYYLRRRIIEACKRLEKTGDAVTEIGLDTGFSSSQYFATVFKRITGLTPQAFRTASRKPFKG